MARHLRLGCPLFKAHGGKCPRFPASRTVYIVNLWSGVKMENISLAAIRFNLCSNVFVYVSSYESSQDARCGLLMTTQLIYCNHSQPLFRMFWKVALLFCEYFATNTKKINQERFSNPNQPSKHSKHCKVSRTENIFPLHVYCIRS